MKIGLLGGTFNPIHNGHLALAEEAKIQFNLDEVWFVPAGNPYQKSKQKNMLPANVRAQLVIDSVGPYEWADVWLGEVESDKPSYTAETLAKLKKQYPEHEFYLIVGADAFRDINISWYQPWYIFENCAIIVAYRSSQYSCELIHEIAYDYRKHYDAKVLEMVFYNDLSSTYIRNKIINGSSYRFDVPYPVYKYIEAYKPYEKE